MNNVSYKGFFFNGMFFMSFFLKIHSVVIIISIYLIDIISPHLSDVKSLKIMPWPVWLSC